MWWWGWAAIAVADPIGGPDPIPAERARTLGAPLVHDIDREAGVLRLRWASEEGGEVVHEIPLASIREVRRVADPEGPHLLAVATDDGTFVLERGPCVLMVAMAPKVAEVLERPLVDGPACEDRTAESIEGYAQHTRESKVTQVRVWDDAVLADVKVTERRSGEPALDVQRGLVGVRPMFGHCFSRQQASGRAGFDATARPDGSFSRISAVSPGSGVGSVDGCIEEQLDEAALSEPPARRQKVHIEVSAP